MVKLKLIYKHWCEYNFIVHKDLRYIFQFEIVTTNLMMKDLIFNIEILNTEFK